MSEELRYWDYYTNNTESMEINPTLDRENKNFLNTIEWILNEI